MCDRPTEGRFGFRPFDVGVDPLMVAGGVREELDAVLGHFGPVAGAEVGADGGPHGIEPFENGDAHGRPSFAQPDAGTSDGR